MIGFNGKHSMKQYLPMRPTKWGFKAFLLCESKTGYCLKHKFFEGKGLDEFKPNQICLDFMSDLKFQGFHVYMDTIILQFRY